MSGNEGQSQFFDEFLDDYFAESDTHLTSIRSNLLSLESLSEQIDEPLTSENSLDAPSIKIELKSLIDELLRSFHTLKGLSGMVGIKNAEALAHEMESYLRALREEQLSISKGGMEGLIAGVKVLEETIAARRTQTPPPEIAAIVAQLTALFPDGEEAAATPEDSKNVETRPIASLQAETRPVPVSSSAPSILSSVQLKPEERERLQTAMDKGARAWHVEFVPDRDRVNRGINVNYVRTRLQEIGELIHASPRLTPEGKTLFDFVVASHSPETQLFPDMEADGISHRYFSPSPPLMAVSPSPPLPISPSPHPVMPSNVVRVDLARLDDLMRMLGELVISRSRLEDQLSRLQNVVPIKDLRPIRETSQTLERQLRDLREGMMRVRLVPISQVFSRMQFVVRDVARETHKKVKLELKGEETEIDKYMVERLMDPLLHLVRNGISHGLESESERSQAGKPAQGNLFLRARTSGEIVILEIEDDGRGVDANKVIERGRQIGAIADQEQQEQIDSIALLDLLCLSGFSTKDQADLTSGRGVGLAVVKNTVQELGGILSLHTAPGEGTKFTIELPLTLAIADALIVSVGGQTFAVPESSVREAIEVEPDRITALEEWNGTECDRPLSAVKHQFTELLSFRQDVLPIKRLAHLFGLEQKFQDRCHAVILGKDLNTVAIIVDRIIGRQEIVVQPLRDPLLQVPGLAGATELGDGHVVLILDVAALIRLSKDSEQWGSIR